MTIARSEEFIKDDTCIFNLFTKLSVSVNTSIQFEQRKFAKAKFCQEVFVMPIHLIIKLYIPEASSYMSPLRAIVKSYQYCGITVIW